MENKNNFNVSEDDLMGLELMDKSMSKGLWVKKHQNMECDFLSNSTLKRGIVGRYIDWDNV